MFEFDELEKLLPCEAYVVTGAGFLEANGIYLDTQERVNHARIYRHISISDQLLSRETCGDRFGYVLGKEGVPLYGVRTPIDAMAQDCPSGGWRAFQAKAPAPRVEGFPTLVDASLHLAQILGDEADLAMRQGRFKEAADILKRAVSNEELPESRLAELHALRARAYRQMAEATGRKDSKSGTDDGEVQAMAGEEPLQGLAAERAIEEADKALNLDPKCFSAGWEGAMAAKHIGWWAKGRELLKRAMKALPAGPAGRSQRETANALFYLLAEEEEAEKRKRVEEMEDQRKLREKKASQPESEAERLEIEWATGVVQQLNDVLKVEDFRRRHHQLWKLITPNTRRPDALRLFDRIRDLVWDKWGPLVAEHGYRIGWGTKSRRAFCTRISDIADTGRAPGVKRWMKEIEDRVCIDWQDIPDLVEKRVYDDTWAWQYRNDGTFVAWEGGTRV